MFQKTLFELTRGTSQCPTHQKGERVFVPSLFEAVAVRLLMTSQVFLSLQAQSTSRALEERLVSSSAFVCFVDKRATSASDEMRFAVASSLRLLPRETQLTA